MKLLMARVEPLFIIYCAESDIYMFSLFTEKNRITSLRLFLNVSRVHLIWRLKLIHVPRDPYQALKVNCEAYVRFGDYRGY